MNLKTIQVLLDPSDKKKTDNLDTSFENIDLVQLLGYLNINRVAAMAFQGICDKNIKYLKKYADFMKNIESSYQYGIIKNNFMQNDIVFISELLDGEKLRYAFLKGSFLSSKVYQKGMRTSNDMDILVYMEDLEEIETILSKKGFVQGYMEYGGEFQVASRKEIIMSRMNYGEVVPYTFFFDDHSLRLDINLSLDYKPLENDLVIREMLQKRDFFMVNKSVKSPTLNHENFLIHLCCHLYKEATTYHWVENSRDLTLYKFLDIYVYLDKFMKADFATRLKDCIHKFRVNKECYYAFTNTMEIFPSLKNDSEVKKLVDNIKPLAVDFMNQVIRPDTREIYEYTIDFTTRLLKNNRLPYLKKVNKEKFHE